jgi:signal transduction histidine kinase
MSSAALLQNISPAWKVRLYQHMSQNEQVRESFTEQIDRFIDLLVQAAGTGQLACLDPLLEEWAGSQTQSDLENQLNSIGLMIYNMMALAYETARDCLPGHQALELVIETLPVFIYAADTAARLETRVLVEHISGELSQANIALAKLEKSKSGFISVAAHELRTPLTLIEGYTAMLKDVLPPESLHDLAGVYLAGMNTGVQRLGEIINDMLDVSMIDNDLLSISYQPVWIDRLFMIIERELKDLLSKRRLNLLLRPFPGWEMMTYGDGERLLQALRNIIHNAVKFTPDGGKIEVGGRLLPGFVEVTIADTGIGIDPQNQQIIFEKFGGLGEPSLHSSSKTKYKGGGAGLGLPIARGIIEAHGGAIWVESDGCDEARCPGSTFHVLIPLIDQPPPDKSSKLFRSAQEASPFIKYRKN